MKNYRDLERMNEQELREFLNKLNTSANDKIAKLRTANVQLESAAYRTDVLNRGIRKFTEPKNASKAALKTAIYAAQHFISSPSSKVENVQAEFRQFKQQFGTQSRAAYRRYVKNYYKIIDKLERFGIFLDSEQTLKVIEISSKTGTFDKNLNRVQDFLSNTVEYSELSDEWTTI